MSTRRVRKEGTIDLPSSDIQHKQERVKIIDRIFILTIIDKPGSILLYVGGYDIYCIDVVIFKKIDGGFQEEALLNKIRSDIVCTVDKNFKESEDTYRIMLFIMTYIKDNFKGVNTLKLTDMSTRKCDNNAYVNLAAMKYFTVGKTWYQDKFNASIHPKNEMFYNSMGKEIQKVKDSLTWEDCRRIFLPIEGLPYEESKMKEIYEKSKTWQEFFKTILDNKGISNLCIWLSTKEWFEGFINYVSFNIFTVQFLVSIDKFTIEYHILPPIGGKRRTRKIIK
jgi:hypothetical protein